MTTVIVALIALIYIPALAVLFVYSINLYYLVIMTLWRKRNSPQPTATVDLPMVTVQLPLYNELYVSQRIIDAAARLEWPRQLLQIQVLDDSTDETKHLVAERVNYWKDLGLNIEHIRRENREGYKAGALAYGLTLAQGDYIAIFDADFIPAPDFLQQMVPSLLNDPGAGFVQARWEHINLRNSWLTRIQAVAIDGHFAIEQAARSYGGFPFNFNGTAGVWRRAAIMDAGGWQHTTLTEDLDLSYRSWLKGWRGLYRPDVASPAELPPTMTAFRRQQSRWAQGSVECARLLLPKVWRSEYSLSAKLQATIHLLGTMVTPIMTLLVMTFPALLYVVSQEPTLVKSFNFFNSLGPLTFAPTLFFMVSQFLLKRGKRAALSVLMFQVISAGMAMNTMRAAGKALTGQQGEFLRTPKWGENGEESSDKAVVAKPSAPTAAPTAASPTYRVKADIGSVVDLLWALFCTLLVLISLYSGYPFITAYAAMSALGTWWVLLATIWPDIQALFKVNHPSLVTPKV